MFDIKERKQFNTVGELMELLKHIPSDTKICITGDDFCWFHIEQDRSVICLDCEDLEDCYEEVENETT